MALKPEVLDRLLLSKSFLARIRFQVVDSHDRATLASHIVTSHDAAELAIAAICDELGCLPSKSSAYLMDYFAPLRDKVHLEREVHAREFFRNLNDARILVKHRGLYVDPKQWHRVAELTFDHISKWCTDYLGSSFAQLDHAALINSKEAREFYAESRSLAEHGKFQEALEALGFALREIFCENAVLYGFKAGNPDTEDALIIAGFGVRPNEFLTLQRLLPRIAQHRDNSYSPKWEQADYGHPGNWTEYTVDFCLRTFVDVALKIQDAQWIPGPVKRRSVYELELEALKDNVEIWHYVKRDSLGNPLPPQSFFEGKLHREVIRTLEKGERWHGLSVSLAKRTEIEPENAQQFQSALAMLAGELKDKATLDVVLVDETDMIRGFVNRADVHVRCVPQDSERVQKNYAWLRPIDWQPE